jgi:predicted O-methyltransferase YrrM
MKNRSGSRVLRRTARFFYEPSSNHYEGAGNRTYRALGDKDRVGSDKTGGKLITIEIDEERYREAIVNFKEAGLSQYIEARHADAHQLVKELPGPLDFVFIDADKNWYIQYAKHLVQKVEPGGCIAAHNVVEPPSHRSGGYWRGTEEYFLYMKTLPEFETRIHPGSPAGLSLSYKKTKE